MTIKRILLLLTGLMFSLYGLAQNSWQERIFMEYYVVDQGDTVYVDELKPAIVFPRLSRKMTPDLRKYYKLVYNFNKVYPFTPIAKNLVQEADRQIATFNGNKIKKDKYMTQLQNQLLKDFEPIIRKMTISQGQLLCRLVDREIGKSTYDIVKDYKSGLAAGFWQGVGKLFDQNLKSKYDPNGEDRMTEYLIEKWEEGEFDALYYSVYWEWPEKTEIPSKYKY